MKVFHIDESLKSYNLPMIKILICITLIISFINRKSINNRIVDIVIGIVCTVVGMICIYSIYISVFELCQVHENRRNIRSAEIHTSIDCKDYAINEIVSLAQNNDIIDMQIMSNGRVIRIGSSSDCKNCSSDFFDKLYYVDDKEVATIGDFEMLVSLYATDKKISVISIDDVKTKTRDGS